MTAKLVPSDPAKVMVFRDVIPKTIATFSTPFWRFGRIKIGGRGTIGEFAGPESGTMHHWPGAQRHAVRLQNGTLAVFSPVALTPEVKEKVSSMGEVKYITALDIEHHIFLGPWHEAYPNAKVLGPEGLAEKRASQKNEDVPFHYVFAKSNPVTNIDADFDREFDYEFVHAHQNKEIVFNHKPTRTLIQADLLFNYPSTEQFSKSGVSATSGILTKSFGYFTNTSGNGQKRMIWYGISSGDRVGYARSVAKINAWDFDKIIPCHGDVIETNGKSIFQKVMEWHLELAKEQS